MMQEQWKVSDVAEIVKGLFLCILLLPIVVIFLVLGTITGLAELFLKGLEK